MTALPYEKTTSGERAIQDIQKVLRSFGCDKFGHMMDFGAGELLVQFEHRGRQVTVKASVNGYAQAWLKANPWSTRFRASRADHERKAKEIGGIAVYSILRDWIKGQITAVETGVLSFEGAFLGQMLLKDGRSVLDHMTTNKLLPPPKES
jgi:hypothetical protein